MNKKSIISIIVVFYAFALISASAQGLIIPLTPSDSTLLPNPRPHKSPDQTTPVCMDVSYIYETNALSINIESAPQTISIILLDDTGDCIYENSFVYLMTGTCILPLTTLQAETIYTLYFFRDDEEWIGTFLYDLYR